MRTATMTVDEAVDEIVINIGHRPIRVTADNRKHVRRWLNARGLPRQFVDLLSNMELQQAYNDSTTTDLGFQLLQRKLDKLNKDSDPVAVVPATVPAVVAKLDGQDEQFWQIIRQRVGQPFDEARIRQIVQECFREQLEMILRAVAELVDKETTK